MNTIRHTFLLLLLLVSSSSLAQNKYDFPQFGRESARFFSQPVRWTGTDWVTLSLMGAGTALAVQFVDLPMRKFTQDNPAFQEHWLVEGARMYGEPPAALLFFGIFGIHSLLTDDIKTRKIGYEIGQSCIYAAAMTFVFKTLTGRARPNVSDSTKDFHPLDPLNLGNDYHSFPSGHTTVAFALSTVFSRNVEPLWAKILVYLPAIMTPATRVYQNKHWISDVMIGAAVGFFAGTWAANIHEENEAAVSPASTAKVQAPSPVYPIFSLSIPFH